CCFKRQLPAQLGKELCAQPRFANDKRACGAHVHGIIEAQFFGEHARTKSPVSSNIDTPEENNQSHAAHCCSTEASRRSGSGRAQLDVHWNQFTSSWALPLPLLLDA